MLQPIRVAPHDVTETISTCQSHIGNGVCCCAQLKPPEHKQEGTVLYQEVLTEH